MGNQYIDVRKEYVERVKRELLGPGSEVCIPDAEHELISSSPSIRYSIGILFPQKQRFTKDNDDATDEEFVTENQKRKTPTAQKPVPTQKRIRLMSKSGWLCRTCRLPWDIRFLPKAAVIHSLSI